MRNHSGRMFSLLGWMGVRAGRPSCRCVDGRRFRHKAPLSMPRKSAERGVSLVPGSLASIFVFFFSFAGRAPEGPLAFRPGQRRRIARDNRHEDHLRVLPLADVDRAHLYSFVSPSPLPAAGSRTKTRPDWSLGDTFGCRYCAYLYALLACKQRPIEKIVNKSVKVGKRLLRHATGMNRTNGRPVGTRYRVGEKEN